MDIGLLIVATGSSRCGSVVESDWESWGCGFNPWPHSVGWGSGVAVSCGVGRRRGSNTELLWLWRRPVATAPIGALEPPYATRATLETAKNKNKTKTKQNKKKLWQLITLNKVCSVANRVVLMLTFFFFLSFCLFAFSTAAPTAYGGSQARGLIRAVASGLCLSHSNVGSVGSKLHLRPIAQLRATLDS